MLLPSCLIHGCIHYTFWVYRPPIGCAEDYHLFAPPIHILVSMALKNIPHAIKGFLRRCYWFFPHNYRSASAVYAVTPPSDTCSLIPYFFSATHRHTCIQFRDSSYTLRTSFLRIIRSTKIWLTGVSNSPILFFFSLVHLGCVSSFANNVERLQPPIYVLLVTSIVFTSQ